MGPSYEKIIHASRDFITLINRDFIYEFVNESYCRQIGIQREDIVGRSVAAIWGEERFESRIRGHIADCFEGKESHDIDRFKFGDGFRYIHVSYFPYGEGEAITHAMIYSHDITALKEMESRLLDFEFKDSTTGLFNRKSFDIVFDMELERARRAVPEGGTRALLLVNLRHFAEINEQYGYEIGDLILESTGIRIKDALRASDYVFRMEGKELAVLLTTMKRSTDAALVAEQICGKATFPYRHKDVLINIGCNVGVAVYPDDGKDRESLLRCAAAAMNDATRRDERFVLSNADLHRRSAHKARLRADIRRALVAEQFETHFQPIVDSGGRIVGAEALIRWHHPELGAISPAEFIPLAEETGDTVMIGRWVMFRVCKHVKRWGAVLGDRYVSVNLSAKEFGGEGLVEYVYGVLHSEKVKPSTLKLEITETQSMTDVEGAIAKINRLSEIGIDVFVDDFGSGYSSLAYLKRLPVKVIKIDKCFVDAIAENQEDRNFITGMIGMIGSKNKEVLVEGVATREQYEILRDLGIQRIQGYYFGKPVPPDEFERLLRRSEPLPEA